MAHLFGTIEQIVGEPTSPIDFTQWLQDINEPYSCSERGADTEPDHSAIGAGVVGRERLLKIGQSRPVIAIHAVIHSYRALDQARLR